jgi:DNA-binding CsgD family transcriptional regulator
VLEQAAQGELTERERKVLELMGGGMTDMLITQNFHISEQEFNTVVSRIKRKTGLQRRAELEQLGRSINDTEKRMN